MILKLAPGTYSAYTKTSKKCGDNSAQHLDALKSSVLNCQWGTFHAVDCSHF